MAFSPEDHLQCPVCHDVYTDPLVLSCSHSFCRACAKNWWDVTKSRLCPLCKTKTSKSKTPCNLVLKNICEDYSRQRALSSPESSQRPGSSSQVLRGSGPDISDPVSRNDPQFKPIIRAAQTHKRELQETLPPLREKLRCLEEARGRFEEAAQNMDVLVQQVEKKMKTHIRRLHQFLETEEEAKLRALREDEQRATRATIEKMEDLAKDIASLAETVRDTEEVLAAEEVPFLLRYKAVRDRVQQCLRMDAPPLLSGPLIDQAKFLDHMASGFWSRRAEVLSFGSAKVAETIHKQEVTSCDGAGCDERVLELIVYMMILFFGCLMVSLW